MHLLDAVKEMEGLCINFRVLRAFVGDRPAVDGLAALCLKTVQNRAIFARFGRFFEKYLDDTA